MGKEKKNSGQESYHISTPQITEKKTEEKKTTTNFGLQGITLLTKSTVKQYFLVHEQIYQWKQNATDGTATHWKHIEAPFQTSSTKHT